MPSNYLLFRDDDNVIPNCIKNNKFWSKIKNKREMIIKTNAGIIKTYCICEDKENTELARVNSLYFRSAISVNRDKNVIYIASLDHAIKHFNYKEEK